MKMFYLKSMRLANSLLKQRHSMKCSKSLLRKVDCRYGDLVNNVKCPFKNTPYNRIEHSARIRHIRDGQREGLLRIKIVIYGTPF